MAFRHRMPTERPMPRWIDDADRFGHKMREHFPFARLTPTSSGTRSSLDIPMPVHRISHASGNPHKGANREMKLHGGKRMRAMGQNKIHPHVSFLLVPIIQLKTIRMKPGSINQCVNDFPAYLGYGKLNPDSYRLSDENAFVLYEYAGVPIMRVEQSKNGVCVDEFYADQSIGMSHGANLQQAIFHHYLSLDQINSPLHRAWIHDLISQGNIYAEYISKTRDRVLFYPAVYLMSIRVPVLDEDLQQVEAFIDFPEIKKLQPKLRPSKLITVYPDRTENLTITMLQITTPIAFTIEVAKVLSDKGIIKKEKRLRAIVNVANPQAGTSIRTFRGTEKDEWLSYSITIKNEL